MVHVEKEVIDRKRFRSFQHGDPGLFRLVECHKYGCLVLEFLAKEKK